MDAVGGVGARPHARHVSRGRDEQRAGGQGILDFEPGVMQRGVLRDVAGYARAPVEDLARGEPRRAVEDRHPIARVLAVAQQANLRASELLVPSPTPMSVIASGMQTIVTSSIAASAPTPVRSATSPPRSRAVGPPTRTTQQRGAAVLEEAAHGMGQEGAATLP